MKKWLAIIVLLMITIVTLLGGNFYYNKKVNASIQKANVEFNANEEKITTKEQSIKNDIPGIVTWGDSLTVGAGGEGTTYPNVLQQLIKTNVYNIPVVNMGVGGEKTNTIMARSGSNHFVVKSFVIPADTSKTEVLLSSSNGNSIAPLRQGDGGINPVNIDGVKGRITITQESYTSKNYTYYFQRSKAGKSVKVSDNTVVRIANDSEYNNYLPIIFMGQNGGWNDDPNVLISQIHSILNMNKWNKKYLILGLTTETAADRADLENKMEKEFGERYINLRKYIVENGLKQTSLKATEADLSAVQVGSVPPSLLSDKVHFNSHGYTIIGNLVYERMNKLGYFDHILKLVKELKTL